MELIVVTNEMNESLHNKIIDVAGELALNDELPPFPTREMIAKAVSERIHVDLTLHHNSTGAYLAEAAFNCIYFPLHNSIARSA